MYKPKYLNEIKTFSSQLNLDFLNNSTICITGGTGLILSYLVDAVLETSLNIKLILLQRNKNSAEKRFERHKSNKNLCIIECDLNSPIDIDVEINYILSGASYTDPFNYAKFPVETITTNVISNNNLFELAKKQPNFKKFIVFSSCEVYGESKDILTEETKGIVNCLDVRSCYNESKRLIETMAISYSHEYNINSVIARLSRVYGPTMKLGDTKVLSQFMLNAINKNNIILKSTGEQQFSYCYVSDAVNAIIDLLRFGVDKHAYNITNDTEIMQLKNIAQLIAKKEDVRVEFQLPTDFEKNGYSRATNAIQDCSKLKTLGWLPKINLQEGIDRTMDIVKERMSQ